MEHTLLLMLRLLRQKGVQHGLVFARRHKAALDPELAHQSGETKAILRSVEASVLGNACQPIGPSFGATVPRCAAVVPRRS